MLWLHNVCFPSLNGNSANWEVHRNVKLKMNEYLKRKNKLISHFFYLFLKYFIPYIFVQLFHHHYPAHPEPLFWHYITPRLSPPPPLSALLSSHFSFSSVPSAFCRPIILPAPHQSVQQQNWPHKKWKGLFKRNGSIMKTYYCMKRCTACGRRRWPAAVLFS